MSGERVKVRLTGSYWFGSRRILDDQLFVGGEVYEAIHDEDNEMPTEYRLVLDGVPRLSYAWAEPDQFECELIKEDDR